MCVLVSGWVLDWWGFEYLFGCVECLEVFDEFEGFGIWLSSEDVAHCP